MRIKGDFHSSKLNYCSGEMQVVTKGDKIGHKTVGDVSFSYTGGFFRAPDWALNMMKVPVETEEISVNRFRINLKPAWFQVHLKWLDIIGLAVFLDTSNAAYFTGSYSIKGALGIPADSGTFTAVEVHDN